MYETSLSVHRDSKGNLQTRVQTCPDSRVASRGSSPVEDTRRARRLCTGLCNLTN